MYTPCWFYLQGYQKLLEDYEAWSQTRESSQHAYTLLMTLPSEVKLSELPNIDLSAFTDSLYQPTVNQKQGGVGYARLAIQLVAHMMGMEFAWMLDDNIQDMYRLDITRLTDIQSGALRVLPVNKTSFADVMGELELQVRGLAQDCVCFCT